MSDLSSCRPSAYALSDLAFSSERLKIAVTARGLGPEARSCSIWGSDEKSGAGAHPQPRRLGVGVAFFGACARSSRGEKGSDTKAKSLLNTEMDSLEVVNTRVKEQPCAIDDCRARIAGSRRVYATWSREIASGSASDS